MATIPEALAIGLQHHRLGQMQLAEQIYLQIIAVEPNHADAIHLLGVIARQMGKYEVAVETIGRAIRLNGKVAAYHNNLGNALKDQGKLDEAAACYRRALELKSEYAEAHNNLAAVFKEQGKLDEAVAGYRRALKLKPDYAEAHNNLANVLREQEKPEEAVAGYRRALELKPNYAEAYNHLGSLWKQQERYVETRETYENALRSNPDRDLLRLSIAAILSGGLRKRHGDRRVPGRIANRRSKTCAREVQRRGLAISRLGAEPPFNLLYHGRNDRPIKEAWARLFRKLPMQETVRAGSSPRPKLGLVVTQSHEGIFLRWCTELLQRLQPKGWEIVVVCSARRTTVPGSPEWHPTAAGLRAAGPDCEDRGASALRRAMSLGNGNGFGQLFPALLSPGAGTVQPVRHAGNFRHPADGLLPLQRVH